MFQLDAWLMCGHDLAHQPRERLDGKGGPAIGAGGLMRRQATIVATLAICGVLVLQPIDQALAGIVVPSGAGTLTIGPQAMEGNLQVHPADAIRAGYDFTMPGSHPAAQVTVDNASVTLAVTCASGPAPPPIAIALPVQTYSDPAGSPSWYPSGDQSSAAVYQGTVIAPDLCSGGVMSGAQGATFTAIIFSTDTSDPINFRFHYSANTAGSWSATITASPTPTAKTVLQATLTPSLALTLTADRTGAIPSDTVTYSGTVTNTGATLGLSGDFTASASGSGTATVASYWDNVATSLDALTWTLLAGGGTAQTGYTPGSPPPITSGMSLTATAVAQAGVTYPSSGDPLLGTTIGAGDSALWHYQANIPLTPAQVTALLDPTRTKAIRNSFHLEVMPPNPNITQPSVTNVDFSGIFFAGSPAPSGAVTNLVVTVQPPSGAAISVTSSTVPGLASLASGASAAYSATYKVPAVPAKGTAETDAAYFARLVAVEGSILSASASATGSSTSGAVTASTRAVTLTEHLPIVAISKTGPATVTAGTTAIYPLSLKDSGGASASSLAITDSVPSGATGTVSGTPASLGPGMSSSGVQATFPVPSSQSPGALTDSAAVSWQDTNANVYGPVSSSFTTTVQNSLSGATLMLSPQTAGPNVVGTSQSLKASLVDRNGAAIANQSVNFAVTGANPTSGLSTTDATGTAAFTYTGTNQGTDQAQATVTAGSLTLQSNTTSISWVVPIQQVTTTTVLGRFFTSDGSGVFNIPSTQSAVFSQSFPTVDFNPPAGTIPFNITGVGVNTRPFTDITTDVNGNFTGSVAAQGPDAQGSLHQAGVGDLFTFNAVFTGTYKVATAGNVTFNFFSDDGFIFGVGGGASRVSGPMVNAPASGLTPFQGYPVMGSFNQPTSPVANSITVNFPSAGSYAYEVDYSECCGGQVSLTMATSTSGHGVAPAGNLALTPLAVATATVGQTQRLTLSAMDASGKALTNLPVVLTVTGPNSQQISLTTDSTGLAQFSYVGNNAGSDQDQVGANVSGMPAVSNIVTVPWLSLIHI